MPVLHISDHLIVGRPRVPVSKASVAGSRFDYSLVSGTRNDRVRYTYVSLCKCLYKKVRVDKAFLGGADIH